MLNLVLFGPPGAGKGTQSKNIIQHYNLIHLSTGDIFRSNISNASELGNLAKSYINKGQLVPDTVTIDMLEAEVEKHPEAIGFIFDGFPRTTTQAKALDQFLEEKGEQVTGMIALEVPETELKERLRKRAIESGRTDDADPEIINNRIVIYNNETAPLKAYYKKQNKLHFVDGKGEIQEITQAIINTVDAIK